MFKGSWAQPERWQVFISDNSVRDLFKKMSGDAMCGANVKGREAIFHMNTSKNILMSVINVMFLRLN